MLELVDNTMFTLEENEKEQAPLGQQIHAVGMCFYKRGDLEKGITTSWVGIATIPKTRCFEVRSQYIVIATMYLNLSGDALSKIYTCILYT